MTGLAALKDEADALRVAAAWGLLRDMTGLRVNLTGHGLAELVALETLVQAAGGRTVSSAAQGSTDLVVTHPELVKGAGFDDAAAFLGATCLTEFEFVARLLPTPGELEAGVRAPFWADRG